MRHALLLFILIGVARIGNSQSTLGVRNISDSDELVLTIFENESCFELLDTRTVSGSLVRMGNDTVIQTGILTGGRDVFGIDTGIIITTGYATEANLPNSSDFSPIGNGGYASHNITDPDALSLADGNQYFDVGIVQFDFVPTTDTLTFNYVFFSEEYCFFNDSESFSDKFGFFLQRIGPSVVDRRNIAVLPNGEQVSSFTITQEKTPDLFINNSIDQGCNGSAPADPDNYAATIYNGYSVKMQAKAAVIPCNRYRLKMIVLDVGDRSADSGVIIEAGSLNAGLITNPEPSVQGEIGRARTTEGCDTASITFRRFSNDPEDRSKELKINYNLIDIVDGNLNPATEGVDFILPTGVVIPANEDSVVVKIPILADALTEGEEAFVIRYDKTCNCEANRDTFYISDLADMEVDLGPDPSVCGGQEVELSPTITNGNGEYTYAWSDGSTSPTLTTVASGGPQTFSLTVSDGCGRMETDEVNFLPPATSASLRGDYSLCGDGTVTVPIELMGATNYTVTVQVESETSGITTSVYDQNGSFTLDFDAPAVIRILSVEAENGCLVNITDSIARVVDPALAINPVITDASCRDTETGSIELTNPGNVPVQAIWSDGESGLIRENLAAGIYTVTLSASDDPTCAVVDSVVVGEPDVFFLSLARGGTVCVGETETITPTVRGGVPPYSFTWNGVAVSDSVLSFILEDGTRSYDFTVRDACDNMLSGSERYTYGAVKAALSGTYSVCNADEVGVPLLLAGSSLYRVSLSENGTTRSFFSTGDTTLIYSQATSLRLLEVTAQNGCRAILSDSLAAVTDGNWEIRADITDVACFGGNAGALQVEVNQGVGAYNYTWDRAGLSGPNLQNLIAGTYRLTVTEEGSNACSFDTLFVISEPATGITLVSDNTRPQDCLGLAYAEASFTGGTGNLTYNWSNGTTGPILGEVVAGTYQLSVSDEKGCSEVVDYELADARRTLTADINATTTILTCQQENLELAAAQNSPPINYLWSDADGRSLGTQDRVTVSRAGTYYLEVSDPDSGCSAVDSVMITADADALQPELPATYPLTCTTSNLDLTVTLSGDADGLSYAWERDGSPVSGSASTLSGVTLPGRYSVTVVRTSTGCSAVATTEVVDDRTEPSIALSSRQLSLNCREESVTLTVLGDVSNTYAWGTTDGTLSGSTDGLSTIATDIGIYTVIATDPTNGCTSQANINVVRDGSTLNVDAGSDQRLRCNGPGTTLRASISPALPGTQLRWYGTDGEVASESVSFNVLEAGTYVLEAIHPESGCSSFDSLEVISDAPTGVTYELQQPPCADVGGRLTVREVEGMSGPYTYSSPSPGVESFAGGLRQLSEGTHTLIVTDAAGCSYEETFQIFEPGEFTGSADDITVSVGRPAGLGVKTNRPNTDGFTWAWSNMPDSSACVDCPNPIVTARESFIAALKLTDADGCVLQLRQNVFVEERNLVYLPTAFNPASNQSANASFTVFGDQDYVEKVNYLRVFDRWGALVYEKTDFPVNDLSAGWDGTFRGQAVQTGIYIYTVSATLDDGSEEIVRGTVTVLSDR